MKKAHVLWLTGLSGAGKSTIARKLELLLEKKDKKVLVLDGDKVRDRLKKPLGFSREHILLNNEGVADLCLENINGYDYILVSVISPFYEARENNRRKLDGSYHEVYVKASLDEVIKRDTKGLYKKALKGEIKNFIGIHENVPYEAPKNCELVIDTENTAIVDSVRKLVLYIEQIEQEDKAIL